MIDLLNQNISSSEENNPDIDEATKQKIIELQNEFNNRFYDILSNTLIKNDEREILLNKLNSDLLLNITILTEWYKSYNYYLFMKLVLDWLYNKNSN